MFGRKERYLLSPVFIIILIVVYVFTMQNAMIFKLTL
jgi:hypothetical protein